MDQYSKTLIKVVYGNSVDLYEVLGLQRNATDEEIKKAYQRECKLLDARANDVVEPSKDKASTVSTNISILRREAIDEAYNTLRDPSMRSRYDALLEHGIGAVLDDVTTQKSSQSHVIDTEADDSIFEDGHSVFDFEGDPNKNDVSSKDVLKEQCDQTETSTACQRRSGKFKWLGSIMNAKKGSKSIENVPAKDDGKPTTAVTTETNKDETYTGGVVMSAKKLTTESTVEDKSRAVIIIDEAATNEPNAAEYTMHAVETEKKVFNTDTPNFLPKSKAYFFGALDDDDSNHKSTTSHLSGLASSVLDKSFDYSFKYVTFKNTENPSVGQCGHVQSKRRYERVKPKKNYEIHRNSMPFLDESVSSESGTKFSDYYSDDDSSVSTLGAITQSEWCFTYADAKDACDQMISSVAELPSIIGEICGFNGEGRSRARQSRRRRHRHRSSR